MFGKPWDVRFRIAHFKNDPDQALKIALDRVQRGKVADVEYVLVVQAITADKRDPQWAPYFRSILGAVIERYPEAAAMRANASDDLAQVLGTTDEGVGLAETAYATWDRLGTLLDTIDSWPKKEPRAKMVRRRLADLYRRLGRQAEADRIFTVGPCRHVEPLVAELRSRGVKVATVVGNDEVVITADVVLDIEALGKRFQLPAEVMAIDEFDLKAYQDLGFHCTAHLVWVLGNHHRGLGADDPQREHVNWFR